MTTQNKMWLVFIVACFALMATFLFVRIDNHIGDGFVVRQRSHTGTQAGVVVRMDYPFVVEINHTEVARTVSAPNTNGITATINEAQRDKETATIKSSYNWLRGVHEIQLALSLEDDTALIESDGQVYRVQAWNDLKEPGLRWETFSNHLWCSEWTGLVLGDFVMADPSGSSEHLHFYAGRPE